jgi:hypothetical protein
VAIAFVVLLLVAKFISKLLLFIGFFFFPRYKSHFFFFFFKAKVGFFTTIPSYFLSLFIVKCLIFVASFLFHLHTFK